MALLFYFSSNLKSSVESIIIKLTSYCPALCTRLLRQLLYGGGVADQGRGSIAGSLGVSDNGSSENELLYQLGIIKDEHTWDRWVQLLP